MLRAVRGSQGAKARRLDIGVSYVSMLCSGHRVPGHELRQRIEAAYRVPYDAWERAAGAADEPIPESGPVGADEAGSVDEGHPARPAPSPPPASGELAALATGTVHERAAALLAFLAVPGRTPTQLAQAREIRHALTLEARMLGAMSTKARLHEHPEWSAFVEQLVAALAPIPGALDALEACLGDPEAAPAERRAA